MNRTNERQRRRQQQLKKSIWNTHQKHLNSTVMRDTAKATHERLRERVVSAVRQDEHEYSRGFLSLKVESLLSAIQSFSSLLSFISI